MFLRSTFRLLSTVSVSKSHYSCERFTKFGHRLFFTEACPLQCQRKPVNSEAEINSDAESSRQILDRQFHFDDKVHASSLRARVQQPREPHRAKVVLIGAPNSGKSTLLNQLLKWKVSSVSSKVHTTRERTVGVLTQDSKQLVFLDTPGMITPEKRKKHFLDISLLTDPHSCLHEADIIVVIVDVANVYERRELHREVLKVLHYHQDQNKTVVLVLNKCDLQKSDRELMHATRLLTDGVIDGKSDWYEPANQSQHHNNSSRELSRAKLKKYTHLFDYVDSTLDAGGASRARRSPSAAFLEGRMLDEQDYEDPVIKQFTGSDAFNDERIVETGEKRILMLRNTRTGAQRTIVLAKRHPRDRVHPVTRRVMDEHLHDVIILDENMSLQRSAGQWLNGTAEASDKDESESETRKSESVEANTEQSEHISGDELIGDIPLFEHDANTQTGDSRAENETAGSLASATSQSDATANQFDDIEPNTIICSEFDDATTDEPLPINTTVIQNESESQGSSQSTDAVTSGRKQGHVAYHLLTGKEKNKREKESRAWHHYYRQELRSIERKFEHKSGYAGFRRVFCVSALENQGINELKEFLFDCTKPADWLYNSDTVTDASPKALAVQYARAALLNHLQARSPYVTDIDISYWTEDDGALKVQFNLNVPTYADKSMLLRGSPALIVTVAPPTSMIDVFQSMLLRGSPALIATVAQEVKQDLMDAFRIEVLVRLKVAVAMKYSKRYRPSTTQQRQRRKEAFAGLR